VTIKFVLYAVMLATLFSPPIPRDSSRWQYVVTSGRGVRVYLDPETISRDGSHVRAWERSDYPQPNADGATGSLQQYEFDCAARTDDVLYLQILDSAGRAMRETTVSAADRRAEPIPPHSVSDAILRRVCASN